MNPEPSLNDRASGSASAGAASRLPRGDMSLARDLHGKGQFDAAAQQYETVLAGQPDHAEALHLYGVVQYQRGRAAEAEALLRRSVTLTAEPMALTDLGAVLAASGRVDEALKRFEQALEIEPRHVHALVRLGNTLVGMQRYEPALAAYDRALAVSPLVLDALCNRGSALRALGRYLEAIETYDRALTVDPRSYESLYNRGHVLRDLHRYAEALQSYDRAIAIRPGNVAMLSIRGRTLVDLGRPAEALASFNEAIAIQPDFVEALYNSAVALERLGRAAEAVQRCERVLLLEPQHSRAFACRGNAWLQTEQYAAALRSYDQALEIDPRSVEALCNRGTALRFLERYEEALQSYDAALAVDKGFAEAWGNRSNVLQDQHRYEDAMASLDRALALRADHPTSWFNRGNVLYEMGRQDAAVQAYDKAIALDPGYRDAHFARGSLYLAQGDFARGWPEYEWRVRDPNGEHSRRVFTQPLWLGEEPLDNKTILIHAEQGFGDTLQFCRYAALLHERGARVVLEVQPALKTLIDSLRTPVQVVAAGELLPPVDYHCPLLSLPFAFKTELQSIPGKVPYLYADAERVSNWDNLLGPKRGLRIGVAWSGNPSHRNDRNRSIALVALLPLLREPNVEWINLQKVVRERDRSVFEQAPLRSFDDDIVDFADTAALVQSVDLVIAVDTAVAHLAGALGRPVWVLLAEPPEWRWMRARSDSPWYPEARLFRQTVAGHWGDVIDAVRSELRTLS
ncbi:tetratricopeptide (TPR) repeat protein [Paraburkholderia sp. GAS38]